MSYYQAPTKYDSAEWSQALVTDYDVSAQTLFVNCPNPNKVIIRTDTTMTVKFELTTNPAITVAANTSFELDLCVSKIYITTTGATAVKIILTQ